MKFHQNIKYKKNYSYIILNKLKKIYRKKINYLHEPYFDKSDEKSLIQSIKTNQVSTAGSITKKFEKAICKFTKSKYTICTSSGTAALHIALILSGVKDGDEVIVPTLNFVAPANAINYCKATPHFIDSSYTNLSIDENYLRDYLKKICTKKKNFSYNIKTKKRISALILPHLFGYAADGKKILSILKKYNIQLIEDAAEGLGVFFKKRHVGTSGKFGILSFNGNKIITTGGGGAILTNSKVDAKKAFKIVSINKKQHQWKCDYYDVGYNYKMPSLNASLGLSQLKKIKILINKKKKNYERMKKVFYKDTYVTLKEIPENTSSNYWIQNLILNKKLAKNSNKIIDALNKNGIFARQAWKLLHTLVHFKNCPKSHTGIAEDIFKRIVSIPSSVKL